MNKPIFKVLIAVFLAALIYFWPMGSPFVQKIVLDGNLDDWKGRASISPSQLDENHIFQSVSWGTNENEQNLYFAVTQKASIITDRYILYRLYLDIHNNGAFDDKMDKFANLICPTGSEGGIVNVKLFSSDGSFINEYEGKQAQKNSSKSGFEFYLPMKDLNILPGQPIRFYFSDGAGDEKLPAAGDIQWKAFPVITRNKTGIIVFALFWLFALSVLYHYRILPLYFVLGAVGLTFLFILVVRGSSVEYLLEQKTGMLLHYILHYFNVTTHVFDKSPGTILVFIKVDESWTTLDIDIESSALLEIAVLLGLVIFYPVYSFGKKLWFVLLGTMTLICCNLLRLILVIFIIYWWGRNFNFLAHTLIGRLFFFFAIILLYWYILTRPSIKQVRKDVNRA